MSMPSILSRRTAIDSSSTRMASRRYSLPTLAPVPSWSTANSYAFSKMPFVRGVKPVMDVFLFSERTNAVR